MNMLVGELIMVWKVLTTHRLTLRYQNPKYRKALTWLQNGLIMIDIFNKIMLPCMSKGIFGPNSSGDSLRGIANGRPRVGVATSCYVMLSKILRFCFDESKLHWISPCQ